MSVTEAMTAIAAGQVPKQLLLACRLEVGGFDAFGVEAIGDAFRRDPISLSFATISQDTAQFAAIVDDQAVFADLYDGNIGRLWRAGRPAPHSPEPFVSVPFDADLSQARGDVAFAASDHPGLSEDAAGRVHDAGLQIIAFDPAAWRSRVFCSRAFGSAARGGALFALYRMSAERVRDSGFGYAVAIWNGEACTIAVDAVPLPGDARVRIVT